MGVRKAEQELAERHAVHRVRRAHRRAAEHHRAARVVGQGLRQAIGEAEMLAADAGGGVALQHVQLEVEAADHRHSERLQRRLDLRARRRRVGVGGGVEQQDRVHGLARVVRVGLGDVLRRQGHVVGQRRGGWLGRLGVAAPFRPAVHDGRQPRAEATVAEAAGAVGLEHPLLERGGEGGEHGRLEAELRQPAPGEGDGRRPARPLRARAQHRVGHGRHAAQRAQPGSPRAVGAQQQSAALGQPGEAGGDEALGVLGHPGRKRPGRGGRRGPTGAGHSSRSHACASFGPRRERRRPFTISALRSMRSTVSQG